MKNKVFAAIFSLLLAFGLWIYVITVVSPDYEDSFYGIPVSLQSEAVLSDRGLIITSTNTGGVTLRLSGNRSDLAGLHSGNIRIVADVSKIYEPGVHNVTYTVSYPGNIAAGAVSVQNKNPDTVQIVVEQLVSKEIAVVIDVGDTKVPADYLCDLENATLSREKITISGPKSVVDQITQARIEIDLTGKKQTINQDFSYTLCDREGKPVTDKLISLVTKDVENVHMTLRIVRIKTIPLEFSVKYGGGVTKENVTITYNLTAIRVSGSESLLDALDKLTFTLDVSTLLEDQKVKIPIELPAGIKNETGKYEVEADVKFQGVGVKTVQVTAFRFENVPAGQQVVLINETLDITLRGPGGLIDGVSASDIEIVLDFADVKPGMSQTVPATVVIDPMFEGVGAVGSYTIAATLISE